MKNNQLNPRPEIEAKLKPWAWGLSAVILIVVVAMRYIKLPVEGSLSFLPPFHSAVNAITGIFLLLALYFIKKKNIIAHRNMIMIAMGLSLVFLLSYVAYHTTSEPTLYCKEGLSRTVYFILLITHILSAAIIFPFILFTFIRGYAHLVDKHKKMARWVFPIWLYVCLTGPICYLMLAPCY